MTIATVIEEATADANAAAAKAKAESEAQAKAAADDAKKNETERAGDIATACATAGVPAMAAVLIKEGVTVEQAKARIEGAKAIREKVALARKSCPQIDEALADQYIAAGASVEKVSADLFDKMAAVQAKTPTRSQHGADEGPGDVAKAWQRSVDKANARISRH